MDRVNAIVLSKPIACWGAEMGANEHGVCIGFSEFSSSPVKEGLTGQDLVRLVSFDLLVCHITCDFAEGGNRFTSTLLKTHSGSNVALPCSWC